MRPAQFDLTHGDAIAPEPTFGTLFPVFESRLIGREREVATVRELLRRDAVRLLSLTGPEGIGKTRLALQIASDAAKDFSGRVVLVALTSTTDPALVPSVINAVIEACAIEIRSPLESLKAWEGLLVLDEFEHVMAAAPCISELLTRFSALKILVTSRVPLRLPSEQEFQVPALALPDLNALPTIDVLSRCAAIQLFIERARAVRPEFSLSNTNASVVAAICERLNGVPLAIELAAARIHELAPRVLLAQLSNRLASMSQRAPHLPARHPPLWTILEWSYGLLSLDDQLLLGRLAVLVGIFSSEVVEAICAEPCRSKPEARIDVPHGLKSLVSKGLLAQIQVRSSKDTEELRFLMLEPVREYAFERLLATGEAERLRQQHAAYYLALAERAGMLSLGAEPLALEHDNFRAAIQWALDRGETETALRLCGALCEFWISRGLLSEGRRWIEAALTRSESVPMYVRAKALEGAGRLVWYQGDQRAARTFLEESLALYRVLGDMHAVANALQNLGTQALFHGHYDRAKTCYEESLALFRASRVEWGIALALEGLGHIARAHGDDGRANNLYAESLAIWEALEYQRGVATALANLGCVALAAGDYAAAASLLETSLTKSQNLDDKGRIAHALFCLGRVALERGDDEQAASFFVQSLHLFSSHGDGQGSAYCLVGLAEVAVGQGQFERAARLFGVAEAIREASGVPLTPVEQGSYMRCVATVRGQIDSTLFAAAWAEGRTMTIEQALALWQLQPGPTLRAETEHRAATPSVIHIPAGQVPAGLTARELDVLRLVAQGLTNAQVAARLVVSPLTVNVHLRSIYSKIGVTTRTAAARFAVEHNLI